MTRLYPRFAALAFAASLVVTGGTLVATGAPAHASEPVGNRDRPAPIRVAYEDLNLKSPAGQRRLEVRVRTAAERLCIGTGLTTLREQRAAIACRDEAIAAARPQIRRLTGAQPVGAVMRTFGR